MSAHSEVTVQMYNVGFGSATLLHIPAPDGRTRRVLIDCGTLNQGPHSIEDVARQIVADVTGEGGPHIDVVIVSHRHKDHVSGFELAHLWSSVVVEEVWMPWTEEPDNPVAAGVRKLHDDLARALDRRLTKGAKSDLARSLVEGAGTNEKAMETLLHGFARRPNGHKARRRYLPVGSVGQSFEPACLPGVKVHVLGPSRDPEDLRDLNPPGASSYLAAYGADRDREDELPFESFEIRETLPHEMRHLALSPAEEAAIRAAVEPQEPALAMELAKATNSTSLMLMFEVGAARLLFTGDAQWIPWRAALDNEETRRLLAETTLYNVGHHGSRNATPVDFVDNVLPKGGIAMLSTLAGRHSSVPKPELLEALAKKVSLVRTDVPSQRVDKRIVRKSNLYVKARVAIEQK